MLQITRTESPEQISAVKELMREFLTRVFKLGPGAD